MSAQSLKALINDEVIGDLYEVNGMWTFAYAQSWLNRPNSHALSPHLPLQSGPIQDTGTVRHVQWYFDNLLPEEGQRTLLAGDAKIDTADAFGLLAYYGSESAGSITLMTNDLLAQNVSREVGLQPLLNQDLSMRIHNMPTIPLTHLAKKRMSLAGAQHKLAVVLKDNELFEPSGATPSTHILKPNHLDHDYPHSVINEFFVMRLARKLSMNVPHVYRRYVPDAIYLIDRFDRVRETGEWHRLHAIDACQLLGFDKSFKYAQGNMANLAALANACRSPAVARVRLLTWLIFNVLIGNTDAHLKNLSFMVTNQGIQLAPHYDMLSTACYETQTYNKTDWPNRSTLAWPILDTNKYSDINRAILLDAGKALMLNKSTALRLIENLSSRIAQTAQDLYDEIVIENTRFVAYRPELGTIFEGELQCLRTIQFSIIRDMLDKVK